MTILRVKPRGGGMRHLAVYLSLALAAPLGHAAAAGGPSFDCAKATTPIEQAICADSTLGDLDKTLAGLLKESLARDPAWREDILSEQRAWLAERDRICGRHAESVSACLVRMYQTRIGQLQILPSSDVTGVCKKIKKAAERYLARPKPAAECRDEKCFYPPSPLDVLAGTPGSGVTKEKHAAELDISSDDFHELVDWASRTPQPFTFSNEIMQALKDEIYGYTLVDRLAGSNFFAATSIQGTGNFSTSGYFDVENGRARPADGPKNWDSDNNGFVARWFGAVDGTQVAFQEDDTPFLTSSLSVAPWVKDHFAPYCTVECKFAPRFSLHVTYNAWDASCSLGSCDALRKAALKLVQKVQENPTATEKLYVGRLTPSPRDSFLLLKRLAEKASADGRVYRSDRSLGPDGIRDDDPLKLPVVINGKFYLASLGHPTIGWRVFSDWGVTFDRLKGDEMVTAASFAIGMAKGSLINVRVK